MKISELLNSLGIKFSQMSCEDFSKLSIIEKAEFNNFDLIKTCLINNGFSLCGENNFCGCKYVCLVFENKKIHVQEDKETIRVIETVNISPINCGVLYENEYPTLVTQVRPAYFSVDCGMCYVIRLPDGRFVIIDSNFGEYEEAERLYETLISQNNGRENIEIAAWFMTHQHSDHIGGFADFLSEYKEKVILNNIFYNWPVKEKITELSEVGKTAVLKFEEAIEEIKDSTVIVTPHSGEEYDFGGVSFKVLFTCEDLYPTFISNFNDSSLVLMMSAYDKKILFLGDVQRQGSEYMCNKYRKEVFQCDILQVGHHGYNGGSDALYRNANPEALLWPCPDFWFSVIKNWKNNEFLLSSSKIKHTYLSGRQQITLDLTEPLAEFLPYNKVSKGEKIVDINFESGRVIDLGWSCVTGGATGYVESKAVISDGGCVLENFSEKYSLCQIAQPGLLRLNPSYKLEFSGKISDGYGEFGLIYNYNEPTVFNSDKVLWLTPKSEKTFVYTLLCNSDEKKACLLENGKLLFDLPYESESGLYFVLKNAKLMLYDIKIVGE